jgi:hypothetical protein
MGLRAENIPVMSEDENQGSKFYQRRFCYRNCALQLFFVG